MKAVVAAFNQEKALVGAFSVIVQPVVEPMDRFAALILSRYLCLSCLLRLEFSSYLYITHWPVCASFLQSRSVIRYNVGEDPSTVKVENTLD